MYKCKCGGNVEELGEIPDYENPCKCKSIAISDLHTKVSELERSIKEKDEQLKEMRECMKWAYCKEIGSDNIIGLDVCDDFKVWCELLKKEE